MGESVNDQGEGKIEHISNIASLGNTISFLRKANGDNGQTTTRTFEVNTGIHPIASDELRQLTSFPFEFSLHEEKGKVVVATGTKDHPADSKELGVSENTLLYAHTHPETSSNVFLSFSDIFATDRLDPKAQQILITGEGLIVYKRPQFDPLRNIPTDQEPRELMSEWGNQRGIDFFDVSTRKGARRFFDLPDDEKIQIAREFAKDTRMITMETRWEDQANVDKILDAINQKSIISDNAAPKLPSVLDDLNVDLESLRITGPRRANIEAIAQHIDYVKFKRGRLLKNRAMRQGWKKFATKLADQGLKENPPAPIKDLLLKLKERALELSID